MKQETTTGIASGTIEIIATGLAFPEGPAFAPDGTLWLVELKGGNLVQYQNGGIKRFATGGAPNGIAIDGNGSICFCDAGLNQIRMFTPGNGQTKTMATHVNDEALNRPNDLAFDSLGNLLFTCPGESRKEPTGYVCVLQKNGIVKKIASGKYFPNGLAFTKDGKSLVIAETYKHRLWKGDWNAEKAIWTNENVWCEIGGPNGPGGPDGMAFDEKENLYVAVYGTSSLRIADGSGKVCSEIMLPAKNPTNCAFDPSGRLGLVVTEAETGVLISIGQENILKK